jgi:ribosome biogenesis protein BMS1
VHIPGAGDFVIDDISELPDPCPLPDKVRKRLSEKQKLIHAPMSDVGGIMYDKDAVYMEVTDTFSKVNLNSEQGQEIPQGVKMVVDLQDVQDTFADKLKNTQLRIFADSAPMNAEDLASENIGQQQSFSDTEEEEDEDEDEEDGIDEETEEDDDDESGEEEDEDMDDEEEEESTNGRHRIRVDEYEPGQSSGEDEDIQFADTDSELDLDSGIEDMDSGLRWKQNLEERANMIFQRHRRARTMMQIVYDEETPITDLKPASRLMDDSDEEDDSDNEKENVHRFIQHALPDVEALDRSKMVFSATDIDAWKKKDVSNA